MQHAIERVERPGESQEALDGKKRFLFDVAPAPFCVVSLFFLCFHDVPQL